MNQTTPAPEVVARENLLGVRIVAGIIDFVLLAILGIAFSALFGDTSSDGGFSVSLSGVPFLIYAALCFLYYFAMEATSGQTVGKMSMKLRVVAVEGELTAGKVAIRTILRIVDGIIFYLLAVILIAVSKNQQRLGDMAAGTLVVRA